MPKLVRNVAIAAAIIIGGYFSYQHHAQFLDWYYLKDYHPPARIAELADKASLTEDGRHLFYRANPQMLGDRASLVNRCQVQGERTIELGCYLSTNQIFLLDIQQPDLKDEEVVTAAHETLHAAYDRLSNKERRQLNTWLHAAAVKITDGSLQDRLATYQKLEPGEQDNELHSILGSEFANLSPELERHYARYFSHRDHIVAYSKAFDQRFDGLHTQIVQLDVQIQSIKQQMHQFLEAGRISSHNALVPQVNALITDYNQKVDQYNQYASDLLGTQPVAGSE